MRTSRIFLNPPGCQYNIGVMCRIAVSQCTYSVRADSRSIHVDFQDERARSYRAGWERADPFADARAIYAFCAPLGEYVPIERAPAPLPGVDTVICVARNAAVPRKIIVEIARGSYIAVHVDLIDQRDTYICVPSEHRCDYALLQCTYTIHMRGTTDDSVDFNAMHDEWRVLPTFAGMYPISPDALDEETVDESFAPDMPEPGRDVVILFHPRFADNIPRAIMCAGAAVELRDLREISRNIPQHLARRIENMVAPYDGS